MAQNQLINNIQMLEQRLKLSQYSYDQFKCSYNINNISDEGFSIFSQVLSQHPYQVEEAVAL